MIEPFVAVVYGLIVGLTAGAFSAYLGWSKSGEIFDARKFINGIATGVIAGIVAVLANTKALTEAADETTLLITLVTIFVAIVGSDSIRTAFTGMIRRFRNIPLKKEAKEQ